MQQYITPFLAASIEVLKTMTFTDARPGNPIKRPPEPASGIVSAVIDLTGKTNGSLSVTFTEPCILQVVNNMLGESYAEMNEQIRDAVGELVNMIAGAARKRLEENGVVLKAGLPRTIVGEGHTIDHMVQGTLIVIPFKTSAGIFYIEACFEK